MEHKSEVKCLVWDLDRTMWDGVLLESDNLVLRPGIEDVLYKLDQRGILLSIASKNNHDLAMQALEKFGIKKYFLYPQISWNAKSSSIEQIQKSLNIGIDTIAFIDDDQFELHEVSTSLPQVQCIQADEYKNILDIPRFNPRFITEDSLKRRQMYLDDITRNELESKYVGPKEEFLASLGMQLVISEAEEYDLKRAEELTVRTNQLNATGKTYDYSELQYFMNSPSHKLFVCELSDKFGSYGKIGLALVKCEPDHNHLMLLLMSCRVLSRGIGTVLLSYIMQMTKEQGKTLLADFRKTDRNEMMYVTYRFANFQECGKSDEGILLLKNDLSYIQAFPKYIDIQTPVTV
ncbi:MAG: HAD-IIIC family phosphatase [Chlamydiales bacterium]|nr:HAD-IIIC family phosphatase [Chlamydiales bacterium]